MNKNLLYSAAGFGVLLVLVVSFFFIVNNKIPRLAYIDLKQIYESFDLTKELDNKVEDLDLQNKNRRDSLLFEIKRLELEYSSKPELSEAEITAYQNKRLFFEGYVKEIDLGKE